MWFKLMCVLACVLFVSCATPTIKETFVPEENFVTFAKQFPKVAEKEGIPELGKCFHIVEEDSHLCLIEEWDITEYMEFPCRLVATEHDWDGVIDTYPDVYMLFGIDSDGDFWVVPVAYLEYPTIYEELVRYVTTHNHKKDPDMINTIPWYLNEPENL